MSSRPSWTARGCEWNGRKVVCVNRGDLAPIDGISQNRWRWTTPGVRARIVAMNLGISNERSEGMGRKVDA